MDVLVERVAEYRDAEDRDDYLRQRHSPNASGTARPTRAAGAVPLSAIAAVGDMIPIDSAIVSQNRSSRLSPPEDAGAR